jgi:hypothetical protein
MVAEPAPELVRPEALPPEPEPEPVSPEPEPEPEPVSSDAAPEPFSPVALSPEPDQNTGSVELPRRTPGTLRGGERRPAEAALMPLRQADRQAFADDVSAFSQGVQGALAARGITGAVVGVAAGDAAIEEGARS